MSSEFSTFTCNNGLQVVVHPSKEAHVTHLGVFIKAGSRDEETDQFGLAHFIEHALFKGTKRRKTFHILSRLDAVGGELNAYTTKEETVLHGSFLNTYLGRAVELLADIVLNATYPEKELIKEKAVVIDEIYSYMDSPSELIFDEFEELTFGNHPLGHPILGTESSVKGLQRKDIQHFLGKYYNAENMVISCVGNVSIKRLKNLLEKHFESLPQSGDIQRPATQNIPPPQSVVKQKPIFQCHALLGGMAYAAEDEKRRVGVLLNNLIGGPGMNSKLNLNVREKHGIAYHIESNYSSYCDAGMFSIYLGTEKEHMNRTLKLIYKELKKLKEKQLTDIQLNSAKKQLLGQVALGQENRLNVMLALGKSLLHFGKIDTLEEITDEIMSISASQVLEIANEMLDERRFSTLIYQPE